MPGADGFGACTRHFHIGLGRIAIRIASIVSTACQEDLLKSADLGFIDTRARADVAHGAAAAAQRAGIGFTAVLQPAVMQAGLVGLQFDGYRPADIALRANDLAGW